MAYTADGVLSQWRTELGLGEYPGGSNRNKVTAWYKLVGPWCDMQTVYEAYQAAGDHGVERNGRFAYTVWHAQWFQRQDRIGRTPKKGALVFYDWAGSRSIGTIDHVGIVEAVHRDGTFTTLEGNLGDRCQRVRRSMAYVVVFGYPNYDGSGKPPASTVDEIIRRGESGPEVLVLQRNLIKLGYKLPKYGADSDFGAETEDALKAFQRDHGLIDDGEYGPLAAAAMKRALGLAPPPKKPTTKPPKPGTKAPKFPLPAGHWFGVESSDRRNHSGYWAADRPYIRQLQQQLKNRGWHIAVTGRYDAATAAIVRAFQADKGLAVDGETGAVTWRAAWEAPVT